MFCPKCFFYFLISTWLIIFEMLTNTVLSCISSMIIHVISYWLQTYCICFKNIFVNATILYCELKKKNWRRKVSYTIFWWIIQNNTHKQVKKLTYLCTFMYIMILIIYLLIMKENSVRWMRKKSREKKQILPIFRWYCLLSVSVWTLIILVYK